MTGSLTWLGHSAFRLDSPGGKRLYVDPFLQGNPKCPDGEQQPERVDLIALTHGHDDHVGSTVELVQKFGCPVIAQVELAGWLSTQGISEDGLVAINKGGTAEQLGIKFTLTNAHHSSSTFKDGAFLYLGEPAGVVVELEDGTTVYFAGDTCVFGDMALIARIYKPDVAVIPIGDYYTMSPREAAVALELLGNPRCVPCHWGTFPALTGTPQELKQLAPKADVVEIDPGDTIDL